MIPRNYSSEGIVLSRKNYSEADRILVLFTEDFGKVTLIAKGVRKPKSRKRGSLEVFSALKFSAAKGRTFDILTETEVVSLYLNIRRDLRKIAVAYSFLETIERTTGVGEKNSRIYKILKGYLTELENSNKLKKLRQDFIYDILVTLGFWPIGRKMSDPDNILEEVIEGRMSSVRVGKKVLT